MSTQWVSLGYDHQIAVSPVHRFGTDAVLLAHFAKPQSDARVCDLGTGCGIIPFLWLRDGVFGTIVGVELQEEAIALTTRSVAAWGYPENVSFLHADLRDWAYTQERQFDLVVCNPPYFPAGSGRVSASPAARLARHEGEGCTFEDICAAAACLLKTDGRFCFCHRPSQLQRLQEILESHCFVVTKQISVSQREDTAPFLLLIEAQRSDCAKHLLHETWVLEKDGVPTPLARHIYAPLFKEDAT